MYGKREYVVFALAALLMVAAIAGSLAIGDARRAEAATKAGALNATASNPIATTGHSTSPIVNPFSAQQGTTRTITHTRAS